MEVNNFFHNLLLDIYLIKDYGRHWRRVLFLPWGEGKYRVPEIVYPAFWGETLENSEANNTQNTTHFRSFNLYFKSRELSDKAFRN